MSQEKLRKSLETLRQDIDQLDEKDQALKDRMNKLANDVEHHLAHPEDKDHSKKLLDSIPGLITEFEVEHPDLTKKLNDILVILSNMGI